ncbi:hypothetical protein [Aeromonas veronii]|uniref:hypothetical protein n=1 Tax=Aeromonas veronii TaxID=654 RepID=UPI0030060FCB
MTQLYTFVALLTSQYYCLLPFQHGNIVGGICADPEKFVKERLELLRGITGHKWSAKFTCNRTTGSVDGVNDSATVEKVAISAEKNNVDLPVSLAYIREDILDLPM